MSVIEALGRSFDKREDQGFETNDRQVHRQRKRRRIWLPLRIIQPMRDERLDPIGIAVSTDSQQKAFPECCGPFTLDTRADNIPWGFLPQFDPVINWSQRNHLF